MDKRNILFGLAAVALMAVIIANPSFASDAGAGKAASAGNTALDTLTGAVTGNLGLVLGLGITVLGLWTWIVGQKTGAGITMIIGGVLLTLAPGLFNGARSMLGGVIDQFGSSGGGSAITVNKTATITN